MMCTVMQSDSLYVQTCVIMGQMSLCCTLPYLHFDFILLHLNCMFYIPFFCELVLETFGKETSNYIDLVVVNQQASCFFLHSPKKCSPKN